MASLIPSVTSDADSVGAVGDTILIKEFRKFVFNANHGRGGIRETQYHDGELSISSYKPNRNVEDTIFSDPLIHKSLSRGTHIVGDRFYRFMRKFGFSGSYLFPEVKARLSTSFVIYSDKLNGEFVALASAGKDTWLIGSKNVVVTFPIDVVAMKAKALTLTDQKYTQVVENVRIITTTWFDNLSSEDYINLHDTFETERLQMTGECISFNSPHLVDYEKECFVAHSLTRNDSPYFTAYPYLEMVERMRKMGATVAELLNVIPVAYGSTDHDALKEIIRNKKNSEGCVGFVVDAEGNVIYAFKEKSDGYTVERTKREVTKLGFGINGSRVNMETIAQNIICRVTKCVTLHTDFDKACIPENIMECIAFNMWLRKSYPTIARPDIQKEWLKLRRDFLPLSESYFAEAIPYAHVDPSSKIVIAVAGIPCSGKSTAALALQWMLQKFAKLNVVVCNQDSCTGSKSSNKKKEFLVGLKSATDDPDVQVIIIDKFNCDVSNLDDYIAVGLSINLLIGFTHPEDAEGEFTKMAELCAERFESRGDKHQTLTVSGIASDGKTTIQNIMKMMSDIAYKNWDSIWDFASAGARIDATKSKENILEQIVNAIVSNDIIPSVTYDICGLIPEALTCVDEYNALLPARNPKHCFICIAVKNAWITDLLATLPADALDGKTVRPSFHVTLAYIASGKICSIVRLAEIFRMADTEGVSVPITLGEFVWNNDILAAPIILPDGFPCDNVQPHITIALRGKTPPVLSNKLIIDFRSGKGGDMIKTHKIDPVTDKFPVKGA
jgi:hypothetical protein